MLRNISFRTRLITAFFVLIISSASATIMIGNTVFGRKVDELASSKVAVDLKVAEQVFNARLEKLRLLTVAASGRECFANESFCRFLLEEVPEGIAVFSTGGGAIACSFSNNVHSGGGAGKVEICNPEDGAHVSTGIVTKQIRAGRMTNIPLAELHETVLMKGTAVASVMALDRSDLRTLGIEGSFERELFLFAAAPLDDERVMSIGYTLNGRNGLVSYILGEVSPGGAVAAPPQSTSEIPA